MRLKWFITTNYTVIGDRNVANLFYGVSVSYEQKNFFVWEAFIDGVGSMKNIHQNQNNEIVEVTVMCSIQYFWTF